MTANRNVLVGGFVLGAAALGILAVFLFGHLQIFNPAIHAAIVFKDSVSGLTIGSPVTFRGVRVGAVETIGITYDPASRTAFIPVTVTLEPNTSRLSMGGTVDPVGLSTLIERGLRAQLNTQSFVTGQAVIDLDFDLSTPADLHATLTSLLEIPTKQSPIQRAKDELSQVPWRELADNGKATLQSLRGLSDKLDHDLPPLLASLVTTSDRSAQAAETATQAVKALQMRLDTTLGDISKFANTGERQLDQRGAELGRLLANSNQTVAQSRELIANLAGLTAPRAATRINVEQILRDLATTAASLRGFANDVEHNPQLLLTGRKP
jgi:paraquat-inducible protein B